MDDKIRINIMVGGTQFPLNVSPSEEPLYREAARQLNSSLEAYAAKYKGSNLPHEYMIAFTALEMAVRYVRLKNDCDVEAVETELQSLNSEVRDFYKK